MKQKKASVYSERHSLVVRIAVLNSEIDAAAAWKHEWLPMNDSPAGVRGYKVRRATALETDSHFVITRDCKPSCDTCTFLRERRSQLSQATQRCREIERLITQSALRRALKSGERDPDTKWTQRTRDERIRDEAMRLRAKGISRGIAARIQKKFPDLSVRQIHTIIKVETTT